MNQRKNGSLTVFFSMIMAGLMIFFVVWFQVEQVMMAQVRGRQVLDFCSETALAGYNDLLYSRYGFFAMESESLLQDDVRYFLEANLPSYRLVDVSVTATAWLTDASFFEQQLSEWMKYRFPATLVDQYTDLLKSLKDVEDVSALIDKELTLSETIESYNDMFSAFITYLEGVDNYGTQNEIYVKGLWNSSKKKENYTALLESIEESEDQTLYTWEEWIGLILESVQNASTLWSGILEEGRRIEPTLRQMREEAEIESQQEEIDRILASLHTGTEADVAIGSALERNSKRLENAREGIIELEADRSLDSPTVNSALNKAENLLQYETNISVAYELQPMNGTRKSWKKLWNEMQGYVTDLSVYVGKENKLSEGKGATLPSGMTQTGTPSGTATLTGLSEWAGGQIQSLDHVILTRAYSIEYATGMFRNLRDAVVRDDANADPPLSLKGEEKFEGYLTAEVEYLIGGEGKELSNCRTVRLWILGIRMLNNLYFLSTDPEKKSTIETMSMIGGIVAPGVGDLILKGIITAVWAGAESYNDYERLIHGKKVPLIKTAEDWKIDLDSLEEKLWESGEGENGNEQEDVGTGLTYTDYLKVLLLFVPQETLEHRIQDLMQLNLEKETGLPVRLAQMPVGFLVEGSFADHGRNYAMRGEYSYQ